MNAATVTTPATTTGSHVTTVDRLAPFDDIAGLDQPDGPWFTVLVPGSGWRSIVVLDQDGLEVEVACEPGGLVRRRLG